MSFKLPRPETIDGFSIVLNTHYAIPAKVNLYFDGEAKPLALTTKTNGERQDFQLEPRQASALVVELADFDKVAKVTGIDNLWIHVKRPADWAKRVRPAAEYRGPGEVPDGGGRAHP